MNAVNPDTIWSSSNAVEYRDVTGVWCIENQQLCLYVFPRVGSDGGDSYNRVLPFEDSGAQFKVHPQWTKTAVVCWNRKEGTWNIWQFHIYYVDEEGYLTEAQLIITGGDMPRKLGNLKDTQKIKVDLSSGIMAVISENRIKVFITKKDDTAVTLVHSPLSNDPQWTQKTIRRYEW